MIKLCTFKASMSTHICILMMLCQPRLIHELGGGGVISPSLFDTGRCTEVHGGAMWRRPVRPRIPGHNHTQLQQLQSSLASLQVVMLIFSGLRAEKQFKYRMYFHISVSFQNHSVSAASQQSVLP